MFDGIIIWGYPLWSLRVHFGEPAVLLTSSGQGGCLHALSWSCGLALTLFFEALRIVWVLSKVFVYCIHTYM